MDFREIIEQLTHLEKLGITGGTALSCISSSPASTVIFFARYRLRKQKNTPTKMGMKLKAPKSTVHRNMPYWIDRRFQQGDRRLRCNAFFILVGYIKLKNVFKVVIDLFLRQSECPVLFNGILIKAGHRFDQVL